MEWLINIFGQVGQRTKTILKIIGSILLFLRPLLAGTVSGIPFSFPAAVPVVDVLLSFLAVLAGVAFVDKFSPERNAMVFGHGTREIVPTPLPVVDVVAVRDPAAAASPPLAGKMQ